MTIADPAAVTEEDVEVLQKGWEHAVLDITALSGALCGRRADLKLPQCRDEGTKEGTACSGQVEVVTRVLHVFDERVDGALVSDGRSVDEVRRLGTLILISSGSELRLRLALPFTPHEARGVASADACRVHEAYQDGCAQKSNPHARGFEPLVAGFSYPEDGKQASHSRASCAEKKRWR